MPDAQVPVSLPSLAEAVAWEGFEVDEIDGSSVARVHSVFFDCDSGEPAWVIAKLGRFGKTIAVPFVDCAAGVDRIWTPYPSDVLKEAPALDAGKPLTREQELLLCGYYGIHDGIGRAKQVTWRPEGAVTSQAADAAG